MMMALTVQHILGILVGISSLCCLHAIRCYQCGSEAIFIENSNLENTVLTLESCANMDNSLSSWGGYAVDCAPGQVCMKTVIDDGFDEKNKHHYYTSTRGCAMRNTSFGKIHPLGCGVLNTNVVPPAEIKTNRFDWACFCNSDYCNMAKSIKPNVAVIWIGIGCLIGVLV